MNDSRREPEEQTPDSSMQATGPDVKPTVKLDQMPEWAASIARAMRESFRMVNANLEVMTNELSVVRERLVVVEMWKNEQDLRASKMSGGVRALSQTDLAHEAMLAQEKVARETLAAEVAELKKETTRQTLLLAELLKLTEKPVVKLIAGAVGTAFLSWLATKGLR